MYKVLRPEHLESKPDSVSANKEWLHWRRTFDNFISVLPSEGLDKLRVLTNFVSPEIFQYIEESTTYEQAMETLHNLFVKPTNEIYARHLLATRREQPGETLDEYLLALKL